MKEQRNTARLSVVADGRTGRDHLSARPLHSLEIILDITSASGIDVNVTRSGKVMFRYLFKVQRQHMLSKAMR